ncbi:hypothetical protein PhCBS80983_g00308 [Powellomyces hirtus]|uniref:Uncharacterized protein n=1 Tax=Powellomyces hirtus TaxID=109895 RepID=A0A507EGY9_9FUNG|nr:hypothetical protein PhCBS80983_g00308 [Powellomyces hirtus]
MSSLPRIILCSAADIAPYQTVLADVRHRFCRVESLRDTDSGYGDIDSDSLEDRELALESVRKWLFRRMEELEGLGPDGEVALDQTAEIIALIMGGTEDVTHKGAETPSDEPEVGSDLEEWAFRHGTLSILEPSASRTGDDIEIGNQVWNAGVILAQIIDQKLLPSHYLTSSHILELGCGTALTSILAAKVVSPSVKMTATDFHPLILETAKQNVLLNAVADRVTVEKLDWNDIPWSNVTLGVDCIMAADVVYDAHHAVLLPNIIRQIFVQAKVSRGCIAIVNRIRDQFLQEIAAFETNMLASGFVGDWQWADEL